MGDAADDIRRQMAAAHAAWVRGGAETGGGGGVSGARAKAGPRPWLDALLAKVAAGEFRACRGNQGSAPWRRVGAWCDTPTDAHPAPLAPCAPGNFVVRGPVDAGGAS
jgi:hypothetical protein